MTNRLGSASCVKPMQKELWRSRARKLVSLRADKGAQCEAGVLASRENDSRKGQLVLGSSGRYSPHSHYSRGTLISIKIWHLSKV